MILQHNYNSFRIARPDNGTFLYFEAKIYQHIPYGSAGTYAEEKPNKWDNWDMYIEGQEGHFTLSWAHVRSL